MPSHTDTQVVCRVARTDHFGVRCIAVARKSLLTLAVVCLFVAGKRVPRVAGRAFVLCRPWRVVVAAGGGRRSCVAIRRGSGRCPA
eukprot:2201272-Alexandrium_andersonii.AAC.1